MLSSRADMRAEAIQRLYVRFGQQLRERRTDAGMTQQELADALGVSRPSVSNIEAGRQHIQLDVLYRLAAVLDLEVHRLLPDIQVADQPLQGLEGLPDDAQAFVRNIIEGSDRQ